MQNKLKEKSCDETCGLINKEKSDILRICTSNPNTIYCTKYDTPRTKGSLCLDNNKKYQ